MFFKNLFLVIVLTVFSSSVFGQSVCGWSRIDSTASPTIKDGMSSDDFKDKGKIEIYDSAGPSGGTKCLKFSNIGGGAEQGSIGFWKAFNLSTSGDSISIVFDGKAFGDSSHGVNIYFRVISQGKIYTTDATTYYSDIWKTISWEFFTPRDANGKACLSLDTLSIFFGYNDDFVNYPFGMLIDNLKIKKFSNGQLVTFDSCGENQAVEEEHGICNMEHEIKVFPNPFSFECHFQGSEKIVIYDISGKKVKTLLKGRIWNGKDELEQQLPNGIYFAKIQIGDKTTTRKVTLLR
ncbi:MAG: T9SS type A sorting domain-containing protein [bacterium]|nr:T9SS type A sorting domain-containing protein [bacterium]